MKEIVNDGFAKVVKPYMDAQDKKSREIIAPVEVSPAEAPHSVGDQIIYNGLLYDVTAPIEVEDSLETSGAGANISPADNIEAQIKATKSQIQAAAAQAADQNKNTQKMLAPVEEDETDASRAYVIGEQLILDGILYNVIDPIAQHGIITAEGAGANIEEADDVTTQLSSINETLTNEVDAIVNVYGSKNLFQYDYPSTTINGVTITINRDKTISLSGTASADTWIILNAKVHLDTTREYILTGCPSGGSASTYNLAASDSNSWWQLDTGAGVSFTPTGADNTQIYIQFPNGTDMTGKVFKPMIRDARIVDSTYEPYSMTNQELTPIAQAVSNRNLLDNPWFTVNQRGQSSYTGTTNKYGFDRWLANSDISKSDDIITFTSGMAYAMIRQRLDKSLFENGKTYTFSFIKSDGSIASESFVYNGTSTAWIVVKEWGIGHYYTTYRNYTDYIEFGIFDTPDASETISFKAVKLELGSVSTLAQDTAPNYATELLKCQRYFQRINLIGFGSIPGILADATTARIPLKLEPEMRTGPSVTISDVNHFIATRGFYSDATALSALALQAGSNTSQFVVLYATLTTAKNAFDPIFLGRDSNEDAAYIDLSADL